MNPAVLLYLIMDCQKMVIRRCWVALLLFELRKVRNLTLWIMEIIKYNVWNTKYSSLKSWGYNTSKPQILFVKAPGDRSLTTKRLQHFVCYNGWTGINLLWYRRWFGCQNCKLMTILFIHQKRKYTQGYMNRYKYEINSDPGQQNLLLPLSFSVDFSPWFTIKHVHIFWPHVTLTLTFLYGKFMVN